jgi:diadenosine tetraphosphate (Ap4A) HIT family hydrolase
MSDPFTLHDRLSTDTTLLTDMPLCRWLLMDDARFPWLILVPRIAGLRELHEVAQQHRTQLFDEIDLASRVLSDLSDAHKLNVAALGNQVPQLHIHIVARQLTDAAWPGPVWGVGEARRYEDVERDALLANLRAKLAT